MKNSFDSSFLKRLLLPLACAPALLAVGNASAVDRTWNGGSQNPSSRNWSVGDNWGGTAPNTLGGDALFFGGNAVLNPINDSYSNTSFAGITFNLGAGAFTLTGLQVRLASGITNSSTNLQTISLNAVNLTGNRTFQTSTGGGDLKITSTIGGAGFGFTKTGEGSLTISGNNTYTGTTTVNAGTLLIGGTLALNKTTTIALGGGTLGFTGGLTVATPGALKLNNGTSILDFGAGADSLTFADSNLVAGGWTGHLSIYNWGGDDSLFFGTNADGLSSTELSLITFYSDNGTTSLGGAAIGADGSVTVAAIPEPATTTMALLGLGTVVCLVFRRRRFAA
jgi:fibronectin-binding autotransporter adhesin